MLFQGSLNAEGFERWLERYLIPSLERISVLIMDNAPIQRTTSRYRDRKGRIKELVKAAGHEVVFYGRVRGFCCVQLKL